MLLVSIAKIQKIIIIRNNIQKKYHSPTKQGEKEGVPISLDTPSWLWYYFCSTIYFSSLTAVFLAADFLAAVFSAFSPSHPSVFIEKSGFQCEKYEDFYIQKDFGSIFYDFSLKDAIF